MKANKFSLSLFALASSIALISCAPKPNSEVNTDMVNIEQSANGKAPTGNLPVIQFKEESHDFGKVTQGERVKFAFTFKNVGGSDLTIENASGSCGCTVPEWPKNPIAPGKEGIVNVEFNSENKSGLQNKTVTLVTNCEPSTKVINISAEVLIPKDRQGETGGANH
jgi:Protein of unknown function (DUF1573)